MTRVGWVMVAATVAACGDNDAADLTRGGSRIAAQWYAADDGTRVATGSLFDRQLGAMCGVMQWVDGVQRCTEADGYIGYLDARCNQPVVTSLATPSSTTAGAWNQTTCGLEHVYRVGAPITQTTYYLATASGCMGPMTSTSLYAAGAEITADKFVTMRRSTAGDERLRSIHLVSDDGAVVPWGIEDTELGTSCYAGDRACMPLSTGELGYADAACTDRIAAVYTGPCAGEVPHYATATDDVCRQQPRTYRLGAVVQPAQIYALDAMTGSCTASAPQQNREYHQLGAEVLPAPLELRYGDAPGRRLEMTYYAGSGIAASSSLLDTSLGTLCNFQLAADGVQRCLPLATNYDSSYFSDPTCGTKVKVVALYRPAAGCPSAPQPQFATGSVSAGTEVRVVTGPYGGKVYWLQPNGTCGQVPLDSYDRYAVGDAIAPSSFVSATLTVDP